MANQTTAFFFTITITTLFLLLSNASSMDCNENDRQALLKIKEAHGFDSSLFDWIPKTNCCTWSLDQCNDKGRVNSLSIYSAFWSAAVLVPSAIGDLWALETLTISASFYGPIPPSIAKLFNLLSLTIYGTKISGPIPDFSASRKLREISISYNKFSGPIPPSFGLLRNLESLDHLKYSQLTGPIPSSLGMLRNLQNLFLSYNQLTGPIPTSFGSLRNIQYLYLDNNQLTGPIPSSLGSLHNLQYLDLNNNQLSGSIPRRLFHSSNNGTGLLLLNLANNYLMGSVVPEYVGNGNLYLLDLSFNNLTGAAQFLSSAQMIYISINLSRNRLRFDFTNVSLSPNISSLSLSYNEIRGSIPESLNGVKQLYWLNLSNNKLCGKIPMGEVTSKFGAESFENNTCLCGTPLPPCAF